VTKLNAPGPHLSEAEVEALLDRAVVAADGAQWVVASGSLAPGTPEDLYARLADAVRPVGARFAVDTSGAALERALTAAPDLVKPNGEELSEVTGVTLEALGDVVLAANQLRAKGIGSVLVSLGPSGAVLVDDEVVHAESDAVVPRSTVGAGDTLLAGFLAAGGEGADALIQGVAWGSAACALPGTAVPGPGDIFRDRVATGPVDPDRRLGLTDSRRATHA
jgi:1-phosphofructokinase